MRAAVILPVLAVLLVVMWWSFSDDSAPPPPPRAAHATDHHDANTEETRPLRSSVDASSSESWRSSSPTATPTAADISMIRQCKPLGATFAKAVSKWLTDTASPKKIKRLIYSCESHRRKRFCGGMGDRFRGMVSSAFLALLSKRRFELFHPVPMPLQDLLRPRLVPWVPTVRQQSEPQFRSASSFEDIDEHMQQLPLNKFLMVQSTNKKIVPMLQPGYPEADIRLQSNTAGIDKYLLRDPVLKQRWMRDLGLPLNCNLTCYFGCMYALLFDPTPALEQEMARVLKNFVVPSSPGRMKTPLAKAVVAAHRGQRPLLPVVGLQLRVGGNWASGFRVIEPFRTVPAAFPFVFEDVWYVRCGGVRRQECVSRTAAAAAAWPVFVTSDSERFVNLTRKTFSDNSVFYIAEDSFQHTDTLNVDKALPEKFKAQTPEEKRRAVYRMTLINHVVLTTCASLVFGQSGFVDTAFWAARNSDDDPPRRPAGVGFFVDMTNNRLAWEHTLTYAHGVPAPAVSNKNRIVDIVRRTDWVSETPFF